MPSIDVMQDATPTCPGTTTNVNYGLGKVKNTADNARLLCGKAMRWQQAAGRWTCPDGHRVSGETVVAINDTISSEAIAA